MAADKKVDEKSVKKVDEKSDKKVDEKSVKKVDEKSVTEEQAYDKSVSMEATGLKVAAEKVVAGITSSVGSQQLDQVACWNCEQALSPDHQCDTVSPASSFSPLPTPVSTVVK